MPTVPEAMSLAVQHHQAGRLAEAAQIYEQVLLVAPNHADALHLFGVVHSQRGQYGAAVDYIQRALQCKPNEAVYQSNLGLAYQGLGRLDEAEDSYRRALAASPDFADGLFHLGALLRNRGKLDEAVDCYRRALAVQPARPDVLNSLGNALRAQGKLDEAIGCYRKALEIRPNFVMALTNLGSALRALGQHQEAAGCLQRAIQIKPDYAEAHHNLGNVLKAAGMLEEAISSYRQAVRLTPGFAKAHYSLGHALKDQGKLDEAAECYRRALELKPGEFTWQLRLSALCPAVFETSEAIDRFRQERVVQWRQFAEQRPSVALSDLAASGCEPPLGLLYHGRSDRPLKEAYAAIFQHSIQSDRPPARSGRPRIGFVVTDGHEGAFLQSMGGILEQMSPDRFELVIVGHPTCAARLQSSIKRDLLEVLVVPERLDLVAQAVRDARFDLLYHWEVGTDATNYFLPFLQPAPVQCTSWGVPDTSGIAQLDCFISSSLVEAEDADEHYSERLITLSTLLTYQSRERLPPALKRRDALGFTARQHLYLCAQNLQKLHPDFDPILAGILRRDAAGVVVLVEDRFGRAAAKLKDRFAATLPDVADRIVFLPRQPYDDYLSLVATSDALLDPLYFGGGFTTYQAFSLDKAIVTLPSQFGRGRYTLGCYRKMGIADCVASDADDYVGIAVRLGTDAEYRASTEEQIRLASPSLFEDIEAVREHERIFEQLIEESRSQQAR